MADESKKKDVKKSITQIAIGLFIAGVILTLSAVSKFTPSFPFYEMIELRLLDQRFKIRGEIFFDPRVGTIDIDALTLSVEGRYQDWTRDKYADVVRTLKDLNARMIGFDVYFVEGSSSDVLKKSDYLEADPQSTEEVMSLFKDHDEDFRNAMLYNGGVILGQTFDSGDSQDSDWVMRNTVPRDAVKENALENMKDFYYEYDNWMDTDLEKYIDIEAPMERLLTASKGVGYAMTVTDIDGSVRHYPVVLIYDGKVWPSLSLMMYLDYVNVPFKNVQVIPGKEVYIPNGTLPNGDAVTTRIPIDDQGLMMVNWAGDYSSENFFHIPHVSLVTNKKNWIKAELSKAVKKIFHDTPESLEDQDIFVSEVQKAGIDITDDLIEVYGLMFNSARIEAGIAEGAVFEVEDVGQDIYEFYLELKIMQDIKEILEADPDISLTNVSQKVSLPEDNIRRSYFMLQDLIRKGGIKPEDHPLYFYEPELNGKILSADDFKDKVFFYGLTAAGTWDLNPMPYSERYAMLGLHANIFNTILTQNFLQRVPFYIDAIILLMFGLFTGLAVPRLKPLTGGALVTVILLSYLVTAQYVFEGFGLWIDVLGAMLVILFGYGLITVYNFFSEEKEKKLIRGMFSRYVTKSVVDELIKNPDMLKLGGENKFLTVFFSDVEGFTSISEKLSPEELVACLNEYLTAMTNIILRYDGMIDKYEGDAIMAVFGTPIAFEDHATRACLVSIEMQKELVELRKKWKEEGKPEMKVRIGLNTGNMVAGNMGAADRLDYTVMGDSVNLGSRLEGANKAYGTFIMISEFTLEKVKDDIITRFLDSLKVKGKDIPIKVYEVLESKETGISAEQQKMLGEYDKGMESYLAQDWDAGIKHFKKAAEIIEGDPPSIVYLKRCEVFKENSPGEDWDGVFTMTTK